MSSSEATPKLSVVAVTQPRRLVGSTKKQRGMSLVQALFVLVLGGIALSVALNQYQAGEKTSRIQKNVGDIMEIIGAAKANYGQFAYKGLTTGVAIGSGVIPKRLVTDPVAGTATNDFSGAIDLVAGAAGTNNAVLTFAGVPSEVCTQLVTATVNAARIITVGGTAVKPLDADLNVGTLNTQCTAAAASDIVWTIGRT